MSVYRLERHERRVADGITPKMITTEVPTQERTKAVWTWCEWCAETQPMRIWAWKYDQRHPDEQALVNGDCTVCGHLNSTFYPGRPGDAPTVQFEVKRAFRHPVYFVPRGCRACKGAVMPDTDGRAQCFNCGRYCPDACPTRERLAELAAQPSAVLPVFHFAWSIA